MATPAHPRPIEPHSDDVADGAFDGAAADVEVVGDERRVGRSRLMLGEVAEGRVESFALALIAGSGLRNGLQPRGQLGEDGGDVASTKALLLLVDPRAQLTRAFAMHRTSGAPQILGEVIPVEAWFRLREVLLLQGPDVFGAVGDEERSLAAVATFYGLDPQPVEQRAVAVERADEPLVDGALDPVGRLPERVDDRDERHLRVLGLLPLRSPRLRLLSTALLARPPERSPRFPAFRLRLPASLVLGVTDHGGAATIDLHDQNLAVILGRWGLLDERAGTNSDPVYHPHRRSRARRPLVGAAELCPRCFVGHHRVQTRYLHHHAEAEQRRQAQLTIHHQIRRDLPPRRAPTNPPGELDPSESRPDLVGPLVPEHEPLTAVRVLHRSRSRRLAGQEQHRQRTPQCEQQRPRLLLERPERAGGPVVRPLDHCFESGLDRHARFFDTRGHGVSFGNG